MATKNQKLRKASWLGLKIDIWKVIAKYSDIISKFATAKLHIYTEEQEDVLMFLEDDVKPE